MPERVAAGPSVVALLAVLLVPMIAWAQPMDAPRRQPDGSIFVPKPSQRLLGLRTGTAEPSEAAVAIQLTGQVVADPNASGLVQASETGRIEPPEGGFPVLGQRVARGEVAFTRAIATPDMMGLVGRLGKVLGPRGLMPNPKVGTVTPDVATAVKNAKAGQVQFRVDKAGIVHATIGRRSFDSDKLQGNLVALVDALQKAKPATSKGVYLRKLAVSSTMGVGVRVDTQTLSAA